MSRRHSCYICSQTWVPELSNSQACPITIGPDPMMRTDLRSDLRGMTPLRLPGLGTCLGPALLAQLLRSLPALLPAGLRSVPSSHSGASFVSVSSRLPLQDT